jgi:tetratricopeptide (TPR) repeat protein
MKRALKQKECQEVLNISSDYNITLSSDWDEGLYDCFMKGADFTAAKKIASDNIKSTDLQLRKKWLYRYIKVDFATGNYSELIDASKDLLVLIEEDKDSQYEDVYRILFDTYARLENKDKMIETIAKVQKIYGINYKDTDRYVAVMTIGSEFKDDNIIIKYATQVIDIQTSSNSFAQSPFVEFTLYQAYINKDDFNKALDVIKLLNTVDLSKEQRSRQKYLLGTVYSRLWRDDEAKQAYQEAIDANPKSAWAKLAQGAMNI